MVLRYRDKQRAVEHLAENYERHADRDVFLRQHGLYRHVQLLCAQAEEDLVPDPRGAAGRDLPRGDQPCAGNGGGDQGEDVAARFESDAVSHHAADNEGVGASTDSRPWTDKPYKSIETPEVRQKPLTAMLAESIRIGFKLKAIRRCRTRKHNGYTRRMCNWRVIWR